MKLMHIFALCMLALVSGCELSPRPTVTESEQPDQFCLLNNSETQVYNCDLSYWIKFWVEQDAIAWSERKQAMQSLDEDVTGQLKRILMSQGQDTPYQDRLRAQTWTQKLLPELTEAMQQMLTVIVYKPSQAMLEYESALTILTRLNGQQAEQLQQQQSQLEQQRSQIDAFMKIEESIVNGAEETP